MKAKVKKVFNIIKKAFWGIVWGVFGVLVITLLWLSVDKFILKSPVPSFFGYSTLTIETGSMNGFSAMVDGGTPKQVSIGDLIVIKKTNDYKIGDVITFLPEGDKIPTTHRIIGYTEDGFVTKGDANNIKDTVPISKDRVLGEVVGHYPQLGKFASWVKQEGWLYLVSALAILALGGFILKSDNEEKDETLATQGATDGEICNNSKNSESCENCANSENNNENNSESE